ncbi:MAG: pyruvate formate lyase-activating protein [Clostridia bacterium]|nr:pyruvate formate lyase-activating protein [Clostridia bacterium]
MIGYIHSKESFGTVDGPGIRYVLFMQGCPMRCLYCHNPDTWKTGQGTPITADEILREFNKNKSFYTKGGITVSGGEPLMQIDFLTELFKKAKEKNIHTCIDTSGVTFNKDDDRYLSKLDELLEFTDLIMLDIKHIDSDKHKELTGKDNKNILEFAEYVDKKNIDLWIRHVVVPSYTDLPENLYNLGKYIGQLKNLKALDVLPYHTMGVNKYKELGIPYKLEGVKPLTKTDAEIAKGHILEGIKSVR